MLKNSERLIRPEKREEVRTPFNEAQNFFKHADADPNKVLEFRPAVNDFVLFDCFQLYTGLPLKEGLGFVAWFASVHREILVAGRETEAQSKWHEMIDPAIGGKTDAQLKAEIRREQDRGDGLTSSES
jgi:hypothetical protein